MKACFVVLILFTTITGSAIVSARTCTDIFASLGRQLDKIVSNDVSLTLPGVKVEGCSKEQLMQLVFDHRAARLAENVTDPAKMFGTWVSDNVLGVWGGMFIPVYEVLVIDAGEVPDEVRVTQKLLRAYDPANWYGYGSAEIEGAIDIMSEGRIATYGEHIVRLARAGELHPRKVRYFDFPIETDRGTSLAMKSQYMSFESIHPIAVRTDGERLVFEFFDRMVPGGNRVMSFQRRAAHLPEIAVLLAWVGEISMMNFHCLLEAMDRPTPAFLAAMGELPADLFYVGIKEAARLIEARDALLEQISSKGSGSDEEKAKIREMMDAQAAMKQTPAMQILMRQVMSDMPFGCPTPY